MTIVGYNKKRAGIKTPAGNKAVASGGATASSSSIEKVQAHYSCGVDGANAVPATSLRGDPFGVSRISQGLYRFRLGGSTDLLGLHGVKKMITAIASLQKSTASVLAAEVASVTDATGTVDVRVIDRTTGAVADPAAAGTHERLHLVVTFDNGAF